MFILATTVQNMLTDALSKFFGKILRTIFLAFDSIIYALISYLYKIFTFLSQIRLFENDRMIDLSKRMYIIVGVVALFLVAYALISAIINPDNATKGKNSSFSGIIKNVIFAIIGIAIVPTIFDYAYEFQKRVLCGNVISNFFAVAPNTENAGTDFSSEMAVTLFQSFFYAKSTDGSNEANQNAYDSIISDDGESLSAAFDSVKTDEKSLFQALGNFDNAFDNNELGYLYLVSTVAGLYCAYVLLGFVIDIAVRSVKLSYLQIIAPIPIMTLIIPNQKQKKVFDNWLEKTTSCFFEVFVRVIAITFAAYAVRYLPEYVFGGTMQTCGEGITGIILLLTKAAFILGIFGFLKQAPKLIGELFPGFNSKGFKLGFKESFADVGGFRALGAAGGFVSSAAKSASMAGSKAADAARLKNNGKLGLKGVASAALFGAAGAATGGIAGAYKGYTSTKDAKKWSDVKNSVGNSAEEVIEERLKKEEREEADNRAHEGWGVKDYIKNGVDNFLSTDRAKYNFQKAKHDRLSAAETAKQAVDSIDDTVLTKKAEKLNLKNYSYLDDLNSNDPDKKAKAEKFQKFKEEFLDKYKDKNGINWQRVQDETSKARKAYELAVEAEAKAKAMIGDERYSEEYITNARKVANDNVLKAQNALKFALTPEQEQLVKQKLQTAQEAKAIADSLVADYSKTPDYIENLRKQAKDNVDATYQEKLTAEENERKYKDYLKEYIHGMSDDVLEAIGDYKRDYIEKRTELETKLKDALGDLSTDKATYDIVQAAIKSGDLNSLINAAKKAKAIDSDTLIIMNSIAEEMRKKQDNKK